MPTHAIGDDEQTEVGYRICSAKLASEDEQGILVMTSFNPNGLPGANDDVVGITDIRITIRPAGIFSVGGPGRISGFEN